MLPSESNQTRSNSKKLGFSKNSSSIRKALNAILIVVCCSVTCCASAGQYKDMYPVDLHAAKYESQIKHKHMYDVIKKQLEKGEGAKLKISWNRHEKTITFKQWVNEHNNFHSEGKPFEIWTFSKPLSAVSKKHDNGYLLVLTWADGSTIYVQFPAVADTSTNNKWYDSLRSGESEFMFPKTYAPFSGIVTKMGVCKKKRITPLFGYFNTEQNPGYINISRDKSSLRFRIPTPPMFSRSHEISTNEIEEVTRNRSKITILCKADETGGKPVISFTTARGKSGDELYNAIRLWSGDGNRTMRFPYNLKGCWPKVETTKFWTKLSKGVLGHSETVDMVYDCKAKAFVFIERRKRQTLLTIPLSELKKKPKIVGMMVKEYDHWDPALRIMIEVYSGLCDRSGFGSNKDRKKFIFSLSGDPLADDNQEQLLAYAITELQKQIAHDYKSTRPDKPASADNRRASTVKPASTDIPRARRDSTHKPASARGDNTHKPASTNKPRGKKIQGTTRLPKPKNGLEMTTLSSPKNAKAKR